MTKETKYRLLAYIASFMLVIILLSSMMLTALRPQQDWWLVGLLSFFLFLTAIFPKADEITSAFMARSWKKSAIEISGMAAALVTIIIFTPGPF